MRLPSAPSLFGPVEYSTQLRQVVYSSNFTCAKSNAKIILTDILPTILNFPKHFARIGTNKMAESDAMCSSCFPPTKCTFRMRYSILHEEAPGFGEEGNLLLIVSFVFDEVMKSQQDQQQRVSNSSKENRCIGEIYKHNVKEDSNETAFFQILSSLTQFSTFRQNLRIVEIRKVHVAIKIP